MSPTILDRLKVCPRSAAELAEETRTHPPKVRQALRELVNAGAICLLDTSREGGPFYCLPGLPIEESRKDEEFFSINYISHYSDPLFLVDDID